MFVSYVFMYGVCLRKEVENGTQKIGNKTNEKR